MKKFVRFPFICALLLMGTSCYPTYSTVHTKRGAVLGGLVGAGAGALIGEHNGRELEGALIGGAVGALTGGVLGSARDEEYYGRVSSPEPNYDRNYAAPVPVLVPVPVSIVPIYRSYGYGGHHHHNYRPRYYCR